MTDRDLTSEEKRLSRLIEDFTAEQRYAAAEYDDATLAEHLETLENVYAGPHDGSAGNALALFYLKVYMSEFVKRGCPGDE